MANTKPLLYYCEHHSPGQHPDLPRLMLYTFKNVATGEEIILRESPEALALTNWGFGEFYADIKCAESQYHILWYIDDKTVSPVDLTFEEVQSEYARMLLESGLAEVTIAAIMKACIKSLGRTV